MLFRSDHALSVLSTYPGRALIQSRNSSSSPCGTWERPWGEPRGLRAGLLVSVAARTESLRVRCGRDDHARRSRPPNGRNAGGCDEVYGLVRNRGVGQLISDRHCWTHTKVGAFCGLSLALALRAAHIIPWGAATPLSGSRRRMVCCCAQRMTICLMPHLVGDAGSDDRLSRDRVRGHRWNDEDRRAAASLCGRRIALPNDERRRLSEAALVYLAPALTRWFAPAQGNGSGPVPTRIARG